MIGTSGRHRRLMRPGIALLVAAGALLMSACSGGGSKSSGLLPPTHPRGTMSVSQLHIYTGTHLGNSVTVTLSPSPAQGNTEVAIVYGYNTGNDCYTMTAPAGWTLYDSTCTGSRNEIWTLTHTAGSGETSYTFSVNTTNTNEYFSVAVYDLSGANSSAPIDGHADKAFGAGTSQATQSLTPTQSGDLAIASFATAYVKDPAIQSPYSFDTNVDSGVYLTTGHQALTGTSATSASANYSSGPATGESNLLLIAPAVPTLQRPMLPEVAMTCSGDTCLPGSGTSLLLWGVEGSASHSEPNCTGNCQAFNNVVLNDCNSYNPSIALYANTNSHETDFTHTDSTGSVRYSYTSESTNCAGFPKLENASNTVVPLLNYSAAQTKTDISTVVTPSYIATGGIFSDNHSFDYAAPLHSYDICNGCGHTWIAGGSSNISLLQNYADETNALSAYRVWLNSLGSAAGSNGNACYTVTSGHCYGDSYEPGIDDSRVRLDEFCNNLTRDLTAIRQEHALEGSNNLSGGPYLGIGLSVLLNTVYAMRTLPHCTNAVLIVQEDYAWQSGNGWEEPVLAAFQAMAPSSDGTPDETVQQPYSYCVYNSCTNDTNIWPEMFIVPYGPTFTVSPYTWAGTTAHSATFCPAAGAPASQQGDSGGIQHLVLTCVAKDQPVLAATYQHCIFLQYDLGACVWILNTATTAATINESGKGYSYAVNFSGCEFGMGSTMGGGNTIAQMFPWIPSTSSLYSAMQAAQSANTQTGCDNGAMQFSPTLPTSVAPNTAVLLVASKPSNY